MRSATLVALILSVLLGYAAYSEATEPNTLEVHFIDCGRNDSILIICGGEAAFIDGGTRYYCSRALEYMKARGVTKLKYYIATHAHKDHVDGAPVILAALPTDEVLYNYELTRQCIADDMRSREEREAVNGATWRQVARGDTFTLGGASLRCVAPYTITVLRSWKDGTENRNSLVFKLEYGDVSFLLTGDTTNDTLKAVLRQDPDDLKCTVFKNPHHDMFLHDEIIYALDADYVVYSTSYEYPPDVKNLRSVRRAGARVYVTSYHYAGTTVFKTDGASIDIDYTYEMERWSLGYEKFTMKVGSDRSVSKKMCRGYIRETLTWSTSDASVATVDLGTGEIFAVGEGECVITATAFDGSQRTIEVTVLPPK